MTWIKAYKGFDKDMKCRGFQFEEGKEYEEQKAKLCEKGFHACEAPIDCLKYYGPATSIYREVELDATDEKSDDTKRVGKKIRIGAKIDVAKICKLQFDYVKEHCTNENNAELGKPATAGSYGAATAGSYGAATAGESGAATAGESGAATAGFRGAATAGSYGAATAGSYGAANSRGASSVGKNGLACARGNEIKVRGGMGAVLVIVQENEDDYEIAEWKAAVVDGITIKPDTWYKLQDGEFVEDNDND